MASHLIRNIDETLYRRVKVRAATEGVTLKQALLRLLTMYADGLKLSKGKA